MMCRDREAPNYLSGLSNGIPFIMMMYVVHDDVVMMM